MNALSLLTSLLRPAVEEDGRLLTASSGIDEVIKQMVARSKSRKGAQLSEDHQLESVRRFWQSQEVKSFRDAYLLSWSLCLPNCHQGACILEDRPRLHKVLNSVDAWSAKPSAYRRCYQGLVNSYFTYDAFSEETSLANRDNWHLLREYLYEHNRHIKDKGINPEWVDTAVEHQQLFGKHPCEPYVEALLRGDAGVIDHLCEQLGINKASWFLRELVLAQVKGATRLGHSQFQEILPRLLPLLAANEVLRDRGMILVLDRYAKVPGTALHPGLRDHAVSWWGNPWLLSNETRWGGVTPEARLMVTEWLKLELIETFFTKLAEDGLGDPRRMNFWKRYVKAIDHIEFALGSFARNSRERDFVALRKKMTGLVRELDASGANNAFIMTLGPLIAVEFSGLGNAFYGYDARRSMPFDTAHPLTLTRSAPNSLKQKSRCILWMQHQDGIHHWRKWEDMFAATLQKEFRIEPSTPPAARAIPPAAAPHSPGERAQQVAAVASQPYTRSALNRFARELGFEVDDKTASGGNLWVRIDESDAEVSQVLAKWGFHKKPGKGWWK